MFARIAHRVSRALDAEASVSTRIVRNVVSILLGDAAAEAVNTVSTARSALSLGPAGFGVLSAAQAFVEPFRALALFGLGVVSMTVAARRGGPDGTLVRTMTGLHGAFTLFVTGILLALAAATGTGGPLALVSVVAVGVFPVVATGAVRVPVQYEQAMHRLVAVPLSVALVRWLLIEVAVRTSNTPLMHQSAITVAAMVGLAATWLVVKRSYPLDGIWDGKLARELMRVAWPAAVLDVTVTIYLKAAYLFLRGRGPVVLGTYAAAERLAQPLLGLSAAIVTSSLPLVARAATTRDAKQLAAIYRTTMRRAVLVVLPTVIVSALAAPWILTRYAPAYVHAVRPFQALLAGVLFMFLNQLSSMFIIGVGRFRTLMIIALCNLVVYVGLASVLVPRYGAVGSALATTIMEGINCAVQIVVVAMLLESRPGASLSTEPRRS